MRKEIMLQNLHDDDDGSKVDFERLNVASRNYQIQDLIITPSLMVRPKFSLSLQSAVSTCLTLPPLVVQRTNRH